MSHDNSIIVSVEHDEGDYLTKQKGSPSSFLKSNYLVSDVNVSGNNSVVSSTGGYRRSPVSCQSVEEESVRSSSSRVTFTANSFFYKTIHFMIETAKLII